MMYNCLELIATHFHKNNYSFVARQTFTIPPPFPGGFPPKMGSFWGSKKTEKAKAKTLAYLCNCLIIKLILFLVKHIVQLLYTAYYQQVILVYKNPDSHRGSLMQSEGGSNWYYTIPKTIPMYLIGCY